MLDMKFVRENPELVKENIRKKFKDAKLPLVDEVIALDARKREVNTRANELRANRNKVSKEIGMLMGKGLKEEAEEKKLLVTKQAEELAALEKEEAEVEAEPAAEEVVAEEPAEEVAVEEPAPEVVVAENEPVAEEADFAE